MNSRRLPIVTLRAMEPEDLELLYRIENDEQLWDVSATSVPYSRFLLRDFIAQSSGDIYADRQVRLIIEDDSHHTVGMADLVNFDPRHLRAEVGIVLERPYRRQGYAQAALNSIHTYATKVLHLHQLYAVIAASNSRALSLFNRIGYKTTATLPDWLSDGHTYDDALLLQFLL